LCKPPAFSIHVKQIHYKNTGLKSQWKRKNEKNCKNFHKNEESNRWIISTQLKRVLIFY